MAIIKSLLNLLDKNKVKYEEQEHKTVYTALDSAETQRIKPQEIVKTMVMKINSEYVLVNIPANKNICLVKTKKIVNDARKKFNKTAEKPLKLAKKVDFAKEAWMKKNFPGKVGATPPFGSMKKLATYVDSSLLKPKKVYINTGDYNISLLIPSKAFEGIEPDFIKGVFSKPKPKKKKNKRKNKK